MIFFHLSVPSSTSNILKNRKSKTKSTGNESLPANNVAKVNYLDILHM